MISRVAIMQQNLRALLARRKSQKYLEIACDFYESRTPFFIVIFSSFVCPGNKNLTLKMFAFLSKFLLNRE